MPVFIDRDSAAVQRFSALLPRVHGVSTADALQSWLRHRPEEYAVLVGPELPLEDALTLAKDLRYTRPSTSVVLVREEIDAEILQQAMQAGVRDVVRSDDAGGLNGALSGAEQLWAALHGGPGAALSARTGQVVTVFSPKGGVGKTTTAVNLALALSAGGARKVCLVDLDLAFGDVAITLQLFPDHTIEEAIGGEDVLDFELLGGLLTRHEESLMVLAAPSLPDARDRVTATLVAKMLRALKHEFDHVVVDTCPTFDEQTLQALDETDECVVVATLDVPTLKNVKVALETLDLLGIAQGSRHLVLNRADEAVGLDAEKVEQILGLPISTMIPSSLDIAASTNAGRPIVVGTPDHPASQAFDGLADRLTGREPVTSGTPATVDLQHEGERRSRWRRNRKVTS